MPKVKKVLARLRALREEKGLRQGRIAERLGINRTTYVRKELGLIPITTGEWIKLAALMNEDPANFFRHSASAVDQTPLETEERLLFDLYSALMPDEREDYIKVISIIFKGIRRKRVRDALKRLCRSRRSY